jgi:hypothetical protein
LVSWYFSPRRDPFQGPHQNEAALVPQRDDLEPLAGAHVFRRGVARQRQQHPADGGMARLVGDERPARFARPAALAQHQRFGLDVGDLQQQLPVAAGVVGDEDAELRLISRRLEVGGAGLAIGADGELALDPLDAADPAPVDPDQVGLGARDGGGQPVVGVAFEELRGHARGGEASEQQRLRPTDPGRWFHETRIHGVSH